MYFVIHFVIKDLTLYMVFVIWQNMQANLSEPGIFGFFLGKVLGLIIIFLPWLLPVLIFCFLVISKHVFFLKAHYVGEMFNFSARSLLIVFSICQYIHLKILCISMAISPFFFLLFLHLFLPFLPLIFLLWSFTYCKILSNK